MMSKLVIVIVMTLCFVGCKSPEARRPISAKSGSFIDKSVERNIQLNAKETTYFEALMSKHSEHDYIASESGFWYYYNTKVEDTLITPDFGDTVNFVYNVKTLNGTTIYSKEDIKTQNYVMDKQELFTGLREGLKLMKSGETVTFMFPSQKAYGYYGDENKIGTSVPIICEVTVFSITDSETN